MTAAKHHSRCSDTGKRTVHVKKGESTWECMACGARKRGDPR